MKIMITKIMKIMIIIWKMKVIQAYYYFIYKKLRKKYKKEKNSYKLSEKEKNEEIINIKTFI